MQCVWRDRSPLVATTVLGPHWPIHVTLAQPRPLADDDNNEKSRFVMPFLLTPPPPNSPKTRLPTLPTYSVLRERGADTSITLGRNEREEEGESEHERTLFEPILPPGERGREGRKERRVEKCGGFSLSSFIQKVSEMEE